MFRLFVLVTSHHIACAFRLFLQFAPLQSAQRAKIHSQIAGDSSRDTKQKQAIPSNKCTSPPAPAPSVAFPLAGSESD